MKCRVRVKKSQLDYFRRIARTTDHEVLAYLVGKVISPELTIIEYFAYPKEYRIQEKGHVQWLLDEWLLMKDKAEAAGLRIIGDMHSHLNWDAVLSPLDYKSHIEEGNRISGLCSVMDRKTRVRFWVAESALPCEIEYA